MATVWPIQPRLLGLKDAAAYLGISTWTIRDWLASGQLLRVTLPGAKGREQLDRPFFDRLDLDELVDAGKALHPRGEQGSEPWAKRWGKASARKSEQGHG